MDIQKKEGKEVEFIKKVILPVGLVGLLLLLFYPIYMVDGKLEFLYLWLLVGIPFGMRRMCIWIVPINHDMTATAGIIALNFIVGGLIGGIVVIVQLLQAVWYCLNCISSIFGRKGSASY